MKRLFKVANVFFENKMDAKAYRDEFSNAHVSNGPDHMGVHGHKSKFRANKAR